MLHLAQVQTAPDHTKLWISVAFAAATFAFLAYVFIKKPVLTDDQRRLLRVFCALLAGGAGAFLAGEALVTISKDEGPMKIAVQGTAGFALFFVVWFTFDPVRKRSGGDAFAIHLVEDMKFERAAQILAEEHGKGVNLDQLEPNEREAKMRGLNVQAKSAQDVLAKLNDFVKAPDHVRPFRVESDGPVFRLVPV